MVHIFCYFISLNGFCQSVRVWPDKVWTVNVMCVHCRRDTLYNKWLVSSRWWLWHKLIAQSLSCNVSPSPSTRPVCKKLRNHSYVNGLMDAYMRTELRDQWCWVWGDEEWMPLRIIKFRCISISQFSMQVPQQSNDKDGTQLTKQMALLRELHMYVYARSGPV